MMILIPFMTKGSKIFEKDTRNPVAVLTIILFPFTRTNKKTNLEISLLCYCNIFLPAFKKGSPREYQLKKYSYLY